MKNRLLLAAIFTLGINTARPAAGPEIKLWPNGLPVGAVQLPEAKVAAAKKIEDPERIAWVDDPTLTLYRAPQAKANGVGLIICPGGAYNKLAWVKEGLEVAEYFNRQGVTCAVLKYRIPRRDPNTPHKEPLQDAQRAIRVMRHNAKSWGIDPTRIGILGFSAGGHLTTMAGLHSAKATYEKTDPADDLSARPDFICPIYPAYYADERNPGPLAPEMKVSMNAPPVFIAVTSDDKLRGYNSAQFYLELKKAGVAAELHVYHKGGHGYGIRPSENPISAWHHRCAEWMKAMGLFAAKE
jgi:acetyl esterase/lipase